MERATKLIVVLWACLAVAAELWLVRSAWPGAVPLTILAFGAAAGATAFDRRAVSAVLAFTYVFPALIGLLHGQYHGYYSVVWTGALLGAIVPDGLRRPWHVPARWRGALVCSALTVVSGALIVIWREMDFYPGLVSHEQAAGPLFMAQWVLHVALGILVGILWFDWLFGAAGLDFRTTIVTPLAASAMVMAGVAFYQLFVDVRFLNNTVFGGIARASGTLFDANVCGAVAAMWIGGALLWAERASGWRPWLMGGGASAAWFTVWATGSRTAFGAAVIVSTFSFPALLLGRRPVAWRRAIPSILALAAVALGLAFLLTHANLTAVGPLRRFWTSLPAQSAESIRTFVIENLWARNGYGSASTEMIRTFPWFGVGLGSFQTLLPEFAKLPPDNAQNWYRHQLTELGVVGSLGWAVWLVLFGAFVLKRRAQAPRVAWIARGMLIAFAAISFVGMPGQDVIVSITFWTTAYWFVSLVGPPPAARIGALGWGLVLTVVAVFVAGTLHAAQTTLRAPARAQRAGLPYGYGFYPPEPDGAGGEQRWARKRAVAVIEAPTPWLKVTITAGYPGFVVRPVNAKLWCDGRLVIDAQLSSVDPLIRFIAVPEGEKRIVIETKVSRVLRPKDFGMNDNRELGLLVKWEFVDAPS